MEKCLHQYLSDSARLWPLETAVVEPGAGHVTYAELDALSDRVRDYLIGAGVQKGDRVGILLHKSIDAVACVYGVLKAGAAYVPVDVTGPIDRAAYIFTDCQVALLIVEDRLAELLKSANEKLDSVHFVGIGPVGLGKAIRTYLDLNSVNCNSQGFASVDLLPEDLAYILYTSGSTGTPKGVPLTHGAGTAFVDWCFDTLAPTAKDRFSAHAPFHFDLSILDLYTPMRCGASIVLLSEELGKDPASLAKVMSEANITIWYSAPSILSLLVQFGSLSDYSFDKIRCIIFAGEVFPVGQLKKLKELIPDPRYLNLYGPTETNVCTYAWVPTDFPKTVNDALPIGRVCEHLIARVIDEDGRVVGNEGKGELVIAGENVMNGYWNLPDQTAAAFIEIAGEKYYRTGDIVKQNELDQFIYLGRNDRMIKKRGYRVELGEVEAKLNLHEDIIEAAAMAEDIDDSIVVVAHFSTVGDKRLSTIKLKQFSAQHLPLYMVPDKFVQHAELPKTSTGKTDFQSLRINQE